MAGYPVVTDSNGRADVLLNGYITRGQGVTAQNMSGVYMADNSTALGNSSLVVAPGNPAPGYTTVEGIPGYPSVAQPGGNPNNVTVPNTDGNSATGANIIDVSYPAGTKGGKGQYPQTETDPVPIPVLTPGWTVQANADEDTPPLTVVVLPQYTVTHGANHSNVFTPTITGGNSSYTVTTVEVDGVTTATLPTGFTLTSASTGEISTTTASTAGTYTLGFRVADGSSPVNYATYEVTVVLT